MRDLALLLGRLALASIFVLSGYQKLTGLDATAGFIATKNLPFPMILALAAGLAEVVLGLAVAVGFKTRLAALGLAAFVVVATYFFHNFWTLEGAARMAEQINALKNLGLVGGFLVLAGAGAGRISVDRG